MIPMGTGFRSLNDFTAPPRPLRKLRSSGLAPRIVVLVRLPRVADDGLIAQVEVQPRAVRRGAGDRIELLRGGDQELLQLRAAGDQVRRQHAEAGDAVLERLAGLV